MALIVILEFGLQLVGVGPANTLFVKSDTADGTFYRANREVGHRFFQPRFRRDFGGDATFAAVKPEGTVRIFVLGASTAIGFPNPYHTAFPRFLEIMLADVAEDVRVEIINCGMTAINSFCLLDFMDEVVEYAPDLVILYAGHNEFVGPYGVTTPFLRFGNDWRGIRLYMLLQRSRLYYCLKQLISAARSAALETPEREPFSLHLIDQEIGPGDPGYRVTVRNFRRNFEEMLVGARRRQVPVLLSTLTSNVRDFYPLRSVCDGEGRSRTIERLASEGRLGEAIRIGEQARSDAPTCADIRFLLGRLYLQQGNIAGARQALSAARDLDRMPLRAPGVTNDIIRDLAATGREHGVLLCDVEAAFASASDYGLPGNDLFTEYLHPTVRGHYLMAREMVHTLASSDLSGPWGLRDPAQGLGDYDWYAQRLGYSLEDQVFGRDYLIRFLHELPYREPPTALRRYLAELMREQVRTIPLLPSGTRGMLVERGGISLLLEVADLLLPEDGDAREAVQALVHEAM